MSIFPTDDEMRAITGPIVIDAAVQLGSLADLYLLQNIEQDDASFEAAPSFEADDVSILFTEVSNAEVLETFGEFAAIVMQGMMSRVAEITAGAVFNITEGDFSGRWLKVEKVIEEPLSDSYTLGLADTAAL